VNIIVVTYPVSILWTVWRISCQKNTAKWKVSKRKYFRYVGITCYRTIISLSLLCL